MGNRMICKIMSWKQALFKYSTLRKEGMAEPQTVPLCPPHTQPDLFFAILRHSLIGNPVSPDISVYIRLASIFQFSPACAWLTLLGDHTVNPELALN